MRKASKMISLSLAAVMLISMPAMAAGSGSPAKGSGGVNDAYKAQLMREAEAHALAAKASGIPTATAIAAADAEKTIGEYTNNAVTKLPKVSKVIPVAQGGKVIINGAPSNQTFSVLKPADGAIPYAQTYASSIGGKTLNVVEIDAAVSFSTATVNFYMPGVTAGSNIKVVQLDGAAWKDLEVAEIRADHVVVNMTSRGTIAFIQVPAQ